MFSYQPEILDYLEGVTDKYGLRRYIKFSSHVKRAHWDDAEYRWHVFTESGQEYVAQFLISGAGALHIPSLPDIRRHRRFRRARLPHRAVGPRRDLTGKRVAVIGTGASAIQVVPELVKTAGQVQLYQRTAAWVKPRINFAFPARAEARLRVRSRGARGAANCHLLGTGQQSDRAGEATAAAEVRGVDVQGQHAPLHQGSRIAGQADAALPRRLQANPHLATTSIKPSRTRRTELITDGIARVTPNRIVTVDGTEHPVDAIVLATGFHVIDWFTYSRHQGRPRRRPGGPLDPGGHDGAPRHHRRRRA